MIKIAICDDEGNIRAHLATLIKAQADGTGQADGAGRADGAGHPPTYQVAGYATPEELLADPQPPDLLFLDIQFGPGQDGMALARQLRQRYGGKPLIIFVTGFDQYVFDAFDVGAFQYLLKPVDEQKFAQVFARAAEALAQGAAPRQALTLHTGNASRTVPLEDIYYIESTGHKVVLHLKEGQLAYYAKLQDLEDQLQGSFFRIHKGYLVNLSYIEGYSRTQVELAGGESLLISKYKYQAFVQAYLRFLKQGAGL